VVTLKVLKIGGSLFDAAPDILRAVRHTDADVLVVPGGGRFADLVRKTYSEKSLSEDAAHWMAVLAMEEYAYYLSDKTGIELTPLLVKKKGIRIVLPYEILKRQDELSHSWDVTSDTIAAWMAYRTGSGLIKATDVDGIVLDGRLLDTVEASNLQGIETCVDKGLPGFLIKNKMDALVVNGLIPSRVEQAVTGKPVTGTTILGK
jgi:5-(aminomethyl)-3-furanmethanol phosphate kinase